MAGLSLACHLAEAGLLRGRRLLVLDRSEKRRNDRTWSYWSHTPTPFDALALRTWDTLCFFGGGQALTLPLGDYRYRTIRGIDFYDYARARLAQEPGVHWHRTDVRRVDDGPDGGVVTDGNGERYAARWVFDSRFVARKVPKQPLRYHYLLQHFRGWVIETSRDAFDVDCPTFFDFRTPQHGVMRFFYVLPFTPRRALVEFTLFSADLLPSRAYDEALRHYLHEVLRLTDFRVVETEQGAIPMWDHPFERRGGQHVLNLGTRGGATKPSTGYTFRRAQHDAARITESLAKNGHPFPTLRGPARYATFDSMLLQILYRRGHLAERIFTDLFRHNPVERLLRFLDEESSPLDDLRVMASVPPAPFLRAFWRVKVRGKV